MIINTMLSRSAAVLAVIAGLGWMSPAWTLSSTQPVVAYSLFDAYYLVEPVTFGLKNESSTTYVLRNSAPWRIVDSRGQTIFTPYALQVMTELKPGESREWTWEQRDHFGKPVPAGRYRVVFNSPRASTAMTITSQKGSRGFFTFGFSDRSTLRVYMSNPHAIHDAIENFYHKNRKSIPIGALADDRPGKSPYDAQWIWHLDPASITMAELAIEACDGLPIHVESNLDYWLQSVKRFCPWSARIMALD